MDKLTAAQRRFGMNMYVSTDKAARTFSNDEICKHFHVPTDHWPLEAEIERKEAVIVELQRLLDVKDAEIDRLLAPTKWWLVLGWVLMAGTVIGVIAGVYEVIT